MKYANFEELPVWKAAIEFALGVFEFTNKGDFRGFGDTKNQLERAAVSISNNIAEGFERGANKELIYFLYIAKGSAGECRSMLRLCESSPRFSNFKFEISNLITPCNEHFETTKWLARIPKELEDSGIKVSHTKRTRPDRLRETIRRIRCIHGQLQTRARGNASAS